MAFSTGADWQFPSDLPSGLPGAFKQEEGDDGFVHVKKEPGTEPIPDASSTSGGPQPTSQPRHRQYAPRTCRICLEVVLPTFHPVGESFVPAAVQPPPRVTYDSEDGGRLLRPCKCKGSQKYVHEACLQAWRMADPLRKRNYWECPTCRYRYRLERLNWSSWISSTAAQIGLTIAIFTVAMFVLGFVADPIINLYLDPYNTVASGGGPTGSLIDPDEPVTWAEHFAKGFASLGLLGFAKFMLSLSPFQFFNIRGSGLGGGRGGLAGNGRDRMRDISWIAVIIGVGTVVFAVWKSVRAWSRRTLEMASERVMDVPGNDDDDDED